MHLIAPPPPKTLTKEWQEASNERAREAKLDPITGAYRFLTKFLDLTRACVDRALCHLGISSEGYSGKGFVIPK